jgi:hypothetical protein
VGNHPIERRLGDPATGMGLPDRKSAVGIGSTERSGQEGPLMALSWLMSVWAY